MLTCQCAYRRLYYYCMSMFCRGGIALLRCIQTANSSMHGWRHLPRFCDTPVLIKDTRCMFRVFCSLAHSRFYFDAALRGS